MLYQVTCACGHTFQINEAQLNSAIPCPACAKPLTIVLETPVAATPVSADSASQAIEPTKRCPYCGEVILAIARKCKHCGEFLDRPLSSSGAPLSAAASPPLTAGATSDSTPGTTIPSLNDPVYVLSTSQWDNFWRYLILFTAFLLITAASLFFSIPHNIAAAIILAALLITVLSAGIFYLRTRGTHITIRPMRIDVERGILAKKLDSLELFRINDTELKQGLIERLIGIGTIHLMTNDSTDEPELTLYQIPRAREILKYIQSQIPIAARQRGAIYMEK